MTDIWKTPLGSGRAWRMGVASAALLAARGVGTVSASAMMLMGVVLLPLPIPLGLPFLAVGGFILWHSCPPVRGFARNWLEAHPGTTRRAYAAAARFRRRRKPRV